LGQIQLILEEVLAKLSSLYPVELNLTLTPILRILEFGIVEVWEDVGGKTVFGKNLL